MIATPAVATSSDFASPASSDSPATSSCCRPILNWDRYNHILVIRSIVSKKLVATTSERKNSWYGEDKILACDACACVAAASCDRLRRFLRSHRVIEHPFYDNKIASIATSLLY